MQTTGAAEPTIERGPALALEAAVTTLLPTTGSVEVQVDSPGREHPTHWHSTPETLLVVDGDILFAWGDYEVRAHSGDRLLLPQGVEHRSVAGVSGCLYVIATEWRPQSR